VIIITQSNDISDVISSVDGTSQVVLKFLNDAKIAGVSGYLKCQDSSSLGLAEQYYIELVQPSGEPVIRVSRDYYTARGTMYVKNLFAQTVQGQISGNLKNELKQLVDGKFAISYVANI
jgi:hypothetical protein